MEEIILVDEYDNIIGYEEKLAAHQHGGRLHRAFSIFIFNSDGKMLLQQRSLKKYHFGGLWTNACCSHPNKGEDLASAVHRKLMQEFGFDTELFEELVFTYKATDKGSGLTEHEIDHVFIGLFDGTPQPNPEEVDDFKWVTVAELQEDIAANPNAYTPWFKIALDRF